MESFSNHKSEKTLEQLLIDKGCRQNKEGKWTCEGSVTFFHEDFETCIIDRQLVPEFDVVGGDFRFENYSEDELDANIKNFKNFPRIIKGDLICNYCNIESFEYFPKQVDGEIKLRDNKITSFEHLNGFYDKLFLQGNNITSFKHYKNNIKSNLNLRANQIKELDFDFIDVHHLNLASNEIKELKNLENCKSKMIFLGGNEIKDIKEIGKYTVKNGLIKLENNKIKSTEGIEKIKVKISLDFSNTSITHFVENDIELNKLVLKNLEFLDNFLNIPKREQIYLPTTTRPKRGKFNKKELSLVLANTELIKPEINHDSKKYYSKLLQICLDENIDLKEIESWPEGFLTDEVKTSAKGIGKFGL